MQLKLFILPVKNLDAAEAEMNAALRSHRVLSVKKELVADGEYSFWIRPQRTQRIQRKQGTELL